MRRRLSVGSGCLLMIFAVMIMGIFGMLACDEARGEEKMAKNTGEAVKQYYKSDGLGEEFVAEVDQIFQEADHTSDPEEWKRQVTKELESRYQVDSDCVSTEIPVKEGQVLFVELDTDLEERTYSVKTWKLLNEEEQREDPRIEVWDGR